MRMVVNTLLILGLIGGLPGCVTSLYHWGQYEQSLYKHYKTPGDLETYVTQLGETLADSEAQQRVPPGLRAEYGYALLKQGKAAEAITQFHREKQAWPESTRLMDLLIQQATAVQKPGA